MIDVFSYEGARKGPYGFDIKLLKILFAME